MKKGEIKQKQGFTIIEVVLVLAITGLIFLMMFIALPALQRSQRDSQRRDDISMFLRKVKDYQTNNRGALPYDQSGTIERGNASSPYWSGFYYDYLGEFFSDPAGDPYKMTVVNCGQANVGATCKDVLNDSTEFPNGYTLKIFKSAVCNGEVAVQSSNPRRIAVQYKLEGGGIYCANT